MGYKQYDHLGLSLTPDTACNVARYVLEDGHISGMNQINCFTDETSRVIGVMKLSKLNVIDETFKYMFK